MGDAPRLPPLARRLRAARVVAAPPAAGRDPHDPSSARRAAARTGPGREPVRRPGRRHPRRRRRPPPCAATSPVGSWSSTRATSSGARARIADARPRRSRGRRRRRQHLGRLRRRRARRPRARVRHLRQHQRRGHRAHDPVPAVALRAGRAGDLDPPSTGAELLERLQGWLGDVGFDPIEMEIDPEDRYGVGVNRLVVDPPPFEPGQHLFTFIR